MSELSPSLHSAAFTGIPNAPADWSAMIGGALDAIASGYDVVASARPDIMGDETRTQAARLIALNDLYQKHVGSRVKLANDALDELGTLPATIYAAEQATFEAPADSAGMMMASEIRQAISRLSPAERTKALEEAVKGGNRTVIAAVVNAPAFLSGVSDDALVGYRRKFIAKHHPELLAQAEAARVMMLRAKGARAALAKLRSTMFSASDEAAMTASIASALKASRHFN